MNSELKKEYDKIEGILKELYDMLNAAKSNGTPEKGINYILDAIKSVREDERKIVKQIRDNIYKRYTIKDINEYASLREKYLKEKEEKEQRRRLIIEKNNKMFSDAYIVFDGEYKIIYNDGNGVLTRRLDRQLLDKDDNNKMDYNICDFLRSIDSDYSTKKNKKYLEGNIPVTYDFSNATKLDRKSYKRLKKVANKGIESNDKINIIGKKNKLKYAGALVALGTMFVLSAIGIKQKNNTTEVEDNISVSNEVKKEESTIELIAKEIYQGKKVEQPVIIKKETSINNKVEQNKQKDKIEEVKKIKINIDNKEQEVVSKEDEFNGLSIGSTVKLPDMDLYYASTESKPVGNTKYLSAPTGIYKISLISIVYKGRCLEVISKETSLDTLREYVDLKYGEDVKVFVNFDVVTEQGKTIYKNVGWTDSEILYKKSKVMIK